MIAPSKSSRCWPSVGNPPPTHSLPDHKALYLPMSPPPRSSSNGGGQKDSSAGQCLGGVSVPPSRCARNTLGLRVHLVLAPPPTHTYLETAQSSTFPLFPGTGGGGGGLGGGFSLLIEEFARNKPPEKLRFSDFLLRRWGSPPHLNRGASREQRNGGAAASLPPLFHPKHHSPPSLHGARIRQKPEVAKVRSRKKRPLSPPPPLVC